MVAPYKARRRVYYTYGSGYASSKAVWEKTTPVVSSPTDPSLSIVKEDPLITLLESKGYRVQYAMLACPTTHTYCELPSRPGQMVLIASGRGWYIQDLEGPGNANITYGAHETLMILPSSSSPTGAANPPLRSLFYQPHMNWPAWGTAPAAASAAADVPSAEPYAFVCWVIPLWTALAKEVKPEEKATTTKRPQTQVEALLKKYRGKDALPLEALATCIQPFRHDQQCEMLFKVFAMMKDMLPLKTCSALQKLLVTTPAIMAVPPSQTNGKPKAKPRSKKKKVVEEDEEEAEDENETSDDPIHMDTDNEDEVEDEDEAETAAPVVDAPEHAPRSLESSVPKGPMHDALTTGSKFIWQFLTKDTTVQDPIFCEGFRNALRECKLDRTVVLQHHGYHLWSFYHTPEDYAFVLCAYNPYTNQPSPSFTADTDAERVFGYKIGPKTNRVVSMLLSDLASTHGIKNG